MKIQSLKMSREGLVPILSRFNETVSSQELRSKFQELPQKEGSVGRYAVAQSPIFNLMGYFKKPYVANLVNTKSGCNNFKPTSIDNYSTQSVNYELISNI